MALISDLKEAADGQFGAALRLIAIAKDLNGVRRRLEQEGRPNDAEAVGSAIERLLAESDLLTTSARRSGRGLVDAIKSSW